MSLDDAHRIVARLGPCAIAIDRNAAPDLARQLALLGCVVNGAAAVPVTAVTTDGDSAIDPAADTLVVVAGGRGRATVEAPLLAGGWRRHPAGLIGVEAALWSTETLPGLTFYRRRVEGEAVGLLDRPADADGAITRFALAADLVRAGDRVLVGGADALAGGAIVAACARGRVVTSVEAADLPSMLAVEPERSLDAIILAGPIDAGTLVAAERALKADGRILVGCDASAGEPEVLLEHLFIIERRHGQSDGGRLIVASANPLDAAAGAAAYRHPAFHVGEGARSTPVDFAAAYDNPHLYRVMVQLGERLGDEIKLARLAECVLDEAGPASADRGAAITVLGYRILDLALVDSVAVVEALIDDYLAATEGANAPHVLRWRLSLLFLAGRLAELTDRPAAALARFHAASLADWQGFSPILTTKAIAATFHAARLHLAFGERGAAMLCFRRGLDTALAAAAAPHERLIGDRAAPVPFYLQEMAEVMDMGGQCAVAINSAHLLDRDPGLFWRQVDAKRFGLFAWADGLAREQRKRGAA